MTVDDILATAELTRRSARQPNFQGENRLLHMFAAHLGGPPQKLLDRLVASAKQICRAGSAGLSLLEKSSDGSSIFRWAAMAGLYRDFIGGTTPGNFSPCGTCLERGTPQLYRFPARYFKYLGAVQPSIYEGLVIPIVVGKEKLGTIWIVSHEESRAFDNEDVRVMASIATFTATVLRQNQLRVATEAALTQASRSEEFLRKVLSSSPDCIKVLDHEGRITFVNDSGLSALKVQPSDVLNKKWLRFWKGKDRALATTAFQTAHDGREGRFQGFRPTFKNEPRWWDVIVNRLSSDEADQPTYLAISRDITERVLAARQIAKANQELAAHAATLEQQVEERTSELQQAGERMRALAQKLVRSQEDERRCLARELHDEVGQQLTGLRFLLEEKQPQSNAPPQATFYRAASIVRQLQKQVRTLSFALRQTLPDHIKLETALHWHLRQLEQTAKVAVRFRCDRLDEEHLGPEVRHTIFRIVQEALTNVIRHSNARQAEVSLSQNSDSIVLDISDDGIGFKKRPSRGTYSVGLLGMEERIILLGGKFAVSSRKNSGTRVSAIIPIQEFAALPNLK